MLSYTRQKKGAGRKLTRPDCIMGRREGTLGNAGGGRLTEKGASPRPPPGKHMGHSCDAAECAARRTSSTPSPCLLALRENPAPDRRVLFGDCSPPPGKRMLVSGNTAQYAAWPCAKIHRRTGAYFSAIARPHPESACCIQATPAHPSPQPCNLHITRPHP